MVKKVVVIIIVIVIILAFLGLSRQIFSALQSSDRLDAAARNLSKLQEENVRLQKALSQVKQEDFIERQARDKLNLARPNETIIIISDEEIRKQVQANEPQIEEKLTNWQGWLKLFL